MTDADLRTWTLLSPQKAASLFEELEVPWWISGGYAIELFVGRRLRKHGDLDIGILKRDQLVIREHLGSWDLQAASGGTLQPWRIGERLAEDVNDVWCRPDQRKPWMLQLHLNDSSENMWEFRRDRRVRRSMTEVVLRDDKEIPYLAPEIQLLFKTKHTRPRDEVDLEGALPLLCREKRRWLAYAISTTSPGHTWLSRL